MGQQNPAPDDTQTGIQEFGITFALGRFMMKQYNAFTHSHGPG